MRLGHVDHGGILTHDAAMSADGRFFAAATFTSDVKVYEACFDRSGAFVRIAKAMDLKGHKGQVRVYSRYLSVTPPLKSTSQADTHVSGGRDEDDDVA